MVQEVTELQAITDSIPVILSFALFAEKLYRA